MSKEKEENYRRCREAVAALCGEESDVIAIDETDRRQLEALLDETFAGREIT